MNQSYSHLVSICSRTYETITGRQDIFVGRLSFGQYANLCPLSNLGTVSVGLHDKMVPLTSFKGYIGVDKFRWV